MTKLHNAEYSASLILALMSDHRERTAAEMRAELHLSIGQIRRALVRLIGQGEIHVYGFAPSS